MTGAFTAWIVCALLVAPAPQSSDEASSARTSWFERVGGRLAPQSRGEERAVQLMRQAEAAVRARELERARSLLEDARIEWPGSPHIAHALGDLHLEEERWAEARREYARGERPGFEFRSEYQSALTKAREGEQILDVAGVPATESALPEGPLPPGMGAAIRKAQPLLEEARREFCLALASPHPTSRGRTPKSERTTSESILKLTRRLDELRLMLEREEPEDGEPSESGEDGEPGEGENESEGEGQGEGEDGEQEQGSGQEGEGQQPPQDPSADESPEDAPESGEGEPPEPLAFEASNLTDQQLADLLARLEEIERQSFALQRQLRERARKSVEKDW